MYKTIEHVLILHVATYLAASLCLFFVCFMHLNRDLTRGWIFTVVTTDVTVDLMCYHTAER